MPPTKKGRLRKNDRRTPGIRIRDLQYRPEVLKVTESGYGGYHISPSGDFLAYSDTSGDMIYVDLKFKTEIEVTGRYKFCPTALLDDGSVLQGAGNRRLSCYEPEGGRMICSYLESELLYRAEFESIAANNNTFTVAQASNRWSVQIFDNRRPRLPPRNIGIPWLDVWETKLLAARLYPKTGLLLAGSEQSFQLIHMNLEAGTAKLLVSPERWSQLVGPCIATFIDDRHLVALTTGSQRSLVAMQISHKAVKILARRRYFGFGVGGEVNQLLHNRETTYLVSKKVRTYMNLIVPLRIRKPQSLLLTAHFAALHSCRKFTLPIIHPVDPILGSHTYDRRIDDEETEPKLSCRQLRKRRLAQI